ncbi:UDP-glycosyltransferase UGT5-like [Lycorma delicatula]|uniref:UDP-glycosyltransferase UGT5-like n=1 Tax=Lycorma delicatula TaxID=130591 RepID=UPI003F517F6B
MNSIREIFVLIITIMYCSAANILCIFPTPSYSHQKPLLTLSTALAKKGHNLTVITPNPSKEPIINHREVDVSFLYIEWKKVAEVKKISLQGRISPKQITGDLYNFLNFITSLLFGSPKITELIRELNNTKYDLILYESFYYSSLLGFADITGNPPIIGLTTLNSLMISDSPQGNPVLPSYIPFPFLPYRDKMTFWERSYNLYLTIYCHYILEYNLKPMHENHIQHFGNIKHTAEELEYSKSLLIVSSDLAIGYPKPVQPNTIYVGPMHITKSESLPQDLLKWMDNAEDGIIYFSLGSNMKGTSVPEEKRAAFIEAFKKFPKIRVLWKWEADIDLPGRPNNVLARKWLPQQSILAHPKLQLFISQVGLQSFQEATYYGVPILGIPMFADQDFNARKVVETGAGLSLEFNDITYEHVYEKLKELLTNSSYKEKMACLSNLMKDRQNSPLDTAVWWVEYVLRHNGAPHLRPASLDLTFYEYYMLDILIVGLIFVIISLYIIYFIHNRFFTYINFK